MIFGVTQKYELRVFFKVVTENNLQEWYHTMKTKCSRALVTLVFKILNNLNPNFKKKKNRNNSL